MIKLFLIFSCRVYCKTVIQTELYPWVNNLKMKMNEMKDLLGGLANKRQVIGRLVKK